MLDWAATEFWAIDEVGNVLRRHLTWTDEPPPAATGPARPPRPRPGHARTSLADLRSRPGPPTCTTDPDARAQTLDWGSLRSAVAVPVPIGSVTRGVLACYSAYTEHPDDVRTAVMTGIAAHIGQFLERRRGWDLTAELGTAATNTSPWSDTRSVPR